MYNIKIKLKHGQKHSVGGKSLKLQLSKEVNIELFQIQYPCNVCLCLSGNMGFHILCLQRSPDTGLAVFRKIIKLQIEISHDIKAVILLSLPHSQFAAKESYIQYIVDLKLKIK